MKFKNNSLNIVIEHIKNICEDGELDKESTCQDFRQVRLEGSGEVARNVPHYNLDMIISLLWTYSKV